MNITAPLLAPSRPSSDETSTDPIVLHHVHRDELTTPAVVGPALRGRPIADYADRYGTELRSGRPVRRRRDHRTGE